MTFTPRSEGRISKVVRRVERAHVNPPARRGRPHHRDSRLRRFELTENMGFDSNATALIFRWTGASYEAIAGTEFEVYGDVFSKFVQNDKPTGQDGARGYAQWMWDRRIWEIIQLEHQARWIKCLIDNGAGYDTTDASWTVDGVVYYDGYQPNTAITTVYNAAASANYIFEGDENDVFYAKYDPGANKYWLYQGECP